MKIKKGESYGDFLRRIQMEANYTQEDLALRLGFSKRAICYWLKGESEPSFSSKRTIDIMARKIRKAR